MSITTCRRVPPAPRHRLRPRSGSRRREHLVGSGSARYGYRDRNREGRRRRAGREQRAQARSETRAQHLDGAERPVPAPDESDRVSGDRRAPHRPVALDAARGGAHRGPEQSGNHRRIARAGRAGDRDPRGAVSVRSDFQGRRRVQSRLGADVESAHRRHRGRGSHFQDERRLLELLAGQAAPERCLARPRLDE